MNPDDMNLMDIAALLLMPAMVTELYSERRHGLGEPLHGIDAEAVKMAYKAAETFAAEVNRRHNVS